MKSNLKFESDFVTRACGHREKVNVECGSVQSALEQILYAAKYKCTYCAWREQIHGRQEDKKGKGF